MKGSPARGVSPAPAGRAACPVPPASRTIPTRSGPAATGIDVQGCGLPRPRHAIGASRGTDTLPQPSVRPDLDGGREFVKAAVLPVAAHNPTGTTPRLAEGPRGTRPIRHEFHRPTLSTGLRSTFRAARNAASAGTGGGAREGPRMNRPCLAAGAALLLAGTALAKPASYAVTGSVALGAPDRWDYVSFDASAGRVYVAHGTRITVVDARRGTVVGALPGLTAAHGMAVDPASGHGYAGTGHGDVLVFDPKTLAAIRTLPGEPDDDGVIADPADHRVFVLNGDSSSATVVDTTDDTGRGLVRLGGKPEFGAVDGRGKLYVNLADTREIVRVDVATQAVEARWAVPDCVSPHGMAMDPATSRVFTSCVDGRLIAVDAVSGAVVATLPIGRGSDAVAFDPTRRLVFSSNSDGTLSVIHEDDADHFTSVAEVPTARGARTLAVDPASGRVFLAAADVDAARPPPQQPGRAPRYSFMPGSLKLLLLDPVAR